MQTNPKLIVFDVNETLLDLTPLKKKVNEALARDTAFDLWFGTLLHYSLVETVTENYNDFSSIAAAAFHMVAHKFEVDVKEDEITSILKTINRLPPHPDVVPALTQLKDAGFKMVALTNGNQKVADTQLAYAEIDRFFTDIISVEKVAKYKPHSGVYTYVHEKLEVNSAEALMIAAHGWDIVGAKRAGMLTAFVARQEKSMYPLAENPDFTGKTVLEVADMLLA